MLYAPASPPHVARPSAIVSPRSTESPHPMHRPCPIYAQRRPSSRRGAMPLIACCAAVFGACRESSPRVAARDSAAARPVVAATVATLPDTAVPRYQATDALPPARTTPAVTTTPAAAARRQRPTVPARAGDPRTPNELGRIPVLEYHLLGGEELRWKVDTAHFRRTLQLLYDRGYRPINITDLLDRKIDLPRGLSPVVLVFDDASPSQFRYVERGGKLEVDPNSALGIMLAFNRTHPEWKRKGVFCMLPAAQSGHAFFGDKGIDGQKSEWRFQKVRFLAEQGFELCNHTLYHANLGKQTDERALEFIARGQMAIDSAVPGYKVRTFALPLGVWPKNRSLAWSGTWTDPMSKRTVRYEYDAVLEVAGGPTRSPYDPQFNPRSIKRVEAFGMEVEKLLDRLDASGDRYVSDGDPHTVAKP